MTARQFYLAPILHPAALLRGRWALEPAQVATLRKARSLAEGAAPPWTETDLRAATSKANLFPTLPQLVDWVKRLGADAAPVACDIECAGPHLVRVGFCRMDTFEMFGVPIRLKGGALYWQPSELPLVVEALDQLLNHPEIPKWFHNGQAFDIPYLQHLGFEISNYAGDTMLLQRFMFPEMPASLQFVASLYADFPHWKGIANPDDEETDK